MKCILVIAGSDPMGGAGIHADIKTVSAIGAHATTVITSVTAQNSKGVRAVHHLPASFIGEQARVILEEIYPDAIKIGMLGTEATVSAVAELLQQCKPCPAVLDPVLEASAGGNLLEPEAAGALKNKLLPLVQVVTPNIPEAEVLTGIEVKNQKDIMEAARQIGELGPAVVITGGHLQGVTADLAYENGKFFWVEDRRIQTPNTHGSGCVFSSALATYLAEGKNVFEATKMAHDFARYAIMYSYVLGNNIGPVNPLWRRKS